MKSEEALGKETMWKLIAGMTIPCILARIVNLLYNVVDRHILCGIILSRLFLRFLFFLQIQIR